MKRVQQGSSYVRTTVIDDRAQHVERGKKSEIVYTLSTITISVVILLLINDD